MGLLRLWLAISVVIFHAGPLYGWKFTGGPAAVQTFFMISGFYIQMILSRKYSGPGGVRAFYGNRFLRLYPIYWMTLAFTLFVSLAGWTALPAGALTFFWKQWWGTLSWQSAGFAALTNLGVFFQDVAMFLTADPNSGALHWTSNFLAEAHPIWLLLVVPQAWSLGIELLFYTIAPWLLKRATGVLATAAVASLALRGILVALGHSADPWTTRLFPTELLFFCVGALASRFHLARLDRRPRQRSVTYAALGAVFLSTAFFQYIPLFTQYGDTPWAYYAVVALALPYLFEATRESKWDHWIGELSYPLYLSHFVVMRLVHRSDSQSASDWTAEVLAYALLLAYVLLLAARPFERLRARRSKQLAAATRARRPVPIARSHRAGSRVRQSA